MKVKLLNFLQPLLLALMIINSGYLSYKYCKFYFGNTLLESFDCADGCDSVMMSSYALLFGIPVPVYGLAYFIGLSALFFLGLKNSKFQKLTSLYLIPGLGFAGYCLFVLYFILEMTCKFCLLSHALLLVFALIYFFQQAKNRITKA